MISTPYVHATEILGGEVGRLVGFGDVHGTAAAISELVLDDRARAELAGRAYRLGRSMTWDQTIETAMCRHSARRDLIPTPEREQTRLQLAG